MGMIDEVRNLFPQAPPAPAPALEMGGEANLKPAPEPYPDMSVPPRAFLDLDATLLPLGGTEGDETVDSSVESDPSEYDSGSDRDDARSEQTLNSDCSGLCGAAKGDYCGYH